MSESTSIVHGQRSWRVATSTVEGYVTQSGGHLGPVQFDLGGRSVSPLSVAPWTADEPGAADDPLLRVLRGDFFAMPFGSNEEAYGTERHPYHGESAQQLWTREPDSTAEELHLSLATTIRPGRIDKWIRLRPGHRAIYQQHRISGMSGPMPLGHHTMLRFPDRPGSGVVTTSPFSFGQVYPGDFEPTEGGHSALQPGAIFDALERVPSADGAIADLTRYPLNHGFDDLVMIVADDSLPLAWTAATFAEQGYVAFVVRDPRVLRNTVLWLSNGGRLYPPWNGRHVAVLGIEDVTAHFHDGLAASAADNPLARAGHPTVLELSPSAPLVVNHVLGVVPIPAGFDAVAAIEPGSVPGTTVLRSRSGVTSTVAVDLDGVLGGNQL